jgi:redox-sensitive bicupin YhaK (pirin superfamily)
MIKLRPSTARGHAEHGWLDSWHTFSFADYYDPKQMGFRALRVINEDRVAPGGGFPTHGHRDMEIISYVLEGGLEHKDSIGTGSVIRPGDVQRMSAGTGVRHSEYNASRNEPVHFLQIWLVPDAAGNPPGYAEKRFTDQEKQGRLVPVASPDGRDGSISIGADATLYAGIFSGAESAELPLAPGRHAWVQVVRGTARVNGQPVSAGDGVALSEESAVRIDEGDAAEVLVFDLK